MVTDAIRAGAAGPAVLASTGAATMAPAHTAALTSSMIAARAAVRSRGGDTARLYYAAESPTVHAVLACTLRRVRSPIAARRTPGRCAAQVWACNSRPGFSGGHRPRAPARQRGATRHPAADP